MGEQIRSTLSKPYVLFGVSHFRDMALVAASPALVSRVVENSVRRGTTHGEGASLILARADQDTEVPV